VSLCRQSNPGSRLLVRPLQPVADTEVTSGSGSAFLPQSAPMTALSEKKNINRYISTYIHLQLSQKSDICLYASP
jgi:hypothetical protein